VGRARRGRAEGLRLSLFVLRHVWAGDRDDWDGPDHLRPLDDRGRLQAQLLPQVLDGRPVARIVSSPYTRCVQSVEPLAYALDLSVETRDELAEGAFEERWRPLLTELASGDVVACVHGDITHDLFGRAGKKGAAWEVDDHLRPLRILLPPM
jgi:phosphohistidine phosphatase SixA